MVENKVSLCRLVLLLCLCFSLMSCASMEKKMDIKREVKVPEEFKETSRVERPAPTPPRTPEFVPAVEDLSLLKARNVDIVARNIALKDVLYTITSATNLNLMIEKDVDDEAPVTLTLKNVSAEDALNAIFSSLDYFYTVKGNMLRVKATDTKTLELGHPAIMQEYKVEVGGDILGSGQSLTAAGGGGGSGSNIKGNITQTTKHDEVAFKFWEGIEKTIANILGLRTGETSTPQSQRGAARPAARAAAATQPGAQAEMLPPPPIPTSSEPGAGPRESFVVNRLTGTIMVTATKRNLEKVEHYINMVRRVISRQVMIEAKIIEVYLKDNFQLGIDWNLATRSITNISGTNDTRVTSSYNVGTTNFNTVVPLANPVFTITGLPSLFGQRGDLSFVVRALEEQGEIRSLSNPKLSIMNGQMALLSVGRNTNFVAKVDTTTTTGTTVPQTTFSVTTSSVLSGIMVGLMPYINEQGEISLTITPIVSDLIELKDKVLGTVGANQIMVTLPTVDLRELSTTVKVKDGDVVVIGGLISKRETIGDNKVPFLGDVPLIGTLFTSRNKGEERRELVVIIQPTLLTR
jgi:MSHA biogenesis protein MshL